jgi:SAM-dependent methyltransferase
MAKSTHWLEIQDAERMIAARALDSASNTAGDMLTGAVGAAEVEWLPSNGVIDHGYVADDGEYREDVSTVTLNREAGSAVGSAGQVRTVALQQRSERRGAMWESFYQNSKDKFFKDRHYLIREFPVLTTLPPVAVCLDVGCGVGNASLPLLSRLDGSEGVSRLLVVAFDLSHTAIGIVNNHPLAQGRDPRITAFQYDGVCEGADSQVYEAAVQAAREASAVSILARISQTPSPPTLPSSASLPTLPSSSELPYNPSRHMDFVHHPLTSGFDLALCYFVMSAAPFHMHIALLKQIYYALKPGGVLLFRDYAESDAAELRFAETSKLDEHTFVRGDGTLATFLSPRKIRWYAASVGFLVEECKDIRKTIVNRMEGAAFSRVWLQAVLRKPPLT